MKKDNQTIVDVFLLLGLSEDPKLQPMIFGLFLFMYLVTVLGNLLIILAINTDSKLHSPMYFFLCNLSSTDICLISTTVPKMLVNILKHSSTISYVGCLTQICFVVMFSGFENFLLAVMAYDRYMAICYPLHYTGILNTHVCVQLILFSLAISITDALLQSLSLLQLSFCTNMEIHHFFCELVQVLKLACSDTFINNILAYVVTTILGGIPLLGIILSYIKIVSSIFRMSSAGGKYKAFSTCGSHLSVVLLFYGTGFGVYISSSVSDLPKNSAIASVMYAVVPSMMNPFIYSLKNKDMKEALKKFMRRSPVL
ncbi:olfactory receptor 7G2-like [Nannospalax galili]|uniref:olfactory receptor 7G2-like n=1 Tax=Nannospalax galili TaxID=1026970 RepID=UPI0004ED3DE5|nr:olfactory receptor 7G2-like [Nannospalax galili]